MELKSANKVLDSLLESIVKEFGSGHNVEVYDNKIKIESNNKGMNNYKTIIQSKSEPNKFTINITAGSIENPSRALNGTWYNYGNKSYFIDEIISQLRTYLI